LGEETLLYDMEPVDKWPDPFERVQVLSCYSRIWAKRKEVGYHTEMKISEILELTWDRGNLKESCITLEAEHTKTEQTRTVSSFPVIFS
jgi:hypothetical protein